MDYGPRTILVWRLFFLLVEESPELSDPVPRALEHPSVPGRRIGQPIGVVDLSHDLERFLPLMPGVDQFVARQPVIKDKIHGGISNHLRGQNSQDQPSDLPPERSPEASRRRDIKVHGCPNTYQEGEKTGRENVDGAASGGIRFPVNDIGPVPE
ncbi:MAG: hypothetical protein LQ349_008374 [Xanthoria aureola]|nr:MAG: hypothetical protein LQ349_008374 [Xanthoria aureola]